MKKAWRKSLRNSYPKPLRSAAEQGRNIRFIGRLPEGAERAPRDHLKKMKRQTNHTRYKPRGWRGESYRHYLASKGIKTNRRYMAYQPTYTGADLPVIAGDAVGTAGAATVALIPLAVTAGALYVGARGVKRISKGDSFFNEKRSVEQSERLIEQYFTSETGFPFIDNPNERKYTYEEVRMTPDEFLRETYKEYVDNVIRSRDGSRIQSFEEFVKDPTVIRDVKQERIMNSLDEGNKMKTPWLEYKDGVREGHEGRNRAVVAKKLGIDEIPVVIVRNNKDRNTMALKMIPTEDAFEMRRKGSVIGSMEAKRTPETMQRIEKSMIKKGFTEPIPATVDELKQGRLQEGKHRLIIAKKLGIKEVPVEVQDE